MDKGYCLVTVYDWCDLHVDSKTTSENENNGEKEKEKEKDDYTCDDDDIDPDDNKYDKLSRISKYVKEKNKESLEIQDRKKRIREYEKTMMRAYARQLVKVKVD